MIGAQTDTGRTRIPTSSPFLTPGFTISRIVEVKKVTTAKPTPPFQRLASCQIIAVFPSVRRFRADRPGVPRTPFLAQARNRL
jgi:hypothetical protein